MIRYGATTLQPNTWYNIAGVYDAAAQTLHVYLNGQLDDGQLVGTVTATQQTSALDVEIGQRPGNPGVYQFNGRIDDVRIADHAITQSQIQTDMATPLAAGNWSYTTTALPDGSHSFTAKATDTAGNTTTTSAVTATVNTGQVDTTPPTETISTTINTDTGATTTITSGGVTKDNTLGLSGTVSDAGGVSSVQIYDGATLLGPATISSGNWSYTTAALLDGSHSFTAKATDTAGNTTTTSAVTATVDTTTPTEGVSTVAFSADTGTNSSDFITKTAAQTISGALSAALASGDVVKVSLDNGTTWQTATATTGSTTFSLSGVTLTGSNTLQVRAEDTAGNFSTAKTQIYVLDTTSPTDSFTGAVLASDTGSSPTDFITSSGAVTFSGAATDTGGAGIDTIQVYNGTTLLGTATVNSGSWTLSTTLQPGTYNSLKVVTTDLAGNSTSATNNQVIVVDTTAPTETISTTIITDTGATGTITSGGVTNDNTLGLSGTVSDAGGVSSVQVYDGATLLGAATSARATGVTRRLRFLTAATASPPRPLTLRATPRRRLR